MKKCLTIAVFTLFYITPNIRSTEIKEIKLDVNYNEKADLIESIGKVESELNPGTTNQIEKARGFLQIRPVCIQEANRILGYNAFDSTDCYNITKSVMIFTIIQDYYNPTWNKEIAAKLWNGGPNWNKKQGVKNYWEKVKLYLKKY